MNSKTSERYGYDIPTSPGAVSATVPPLTNEGLADKFSDAWSRGDTDAASVYAKQLQDRLHGDALEENRRRKEAAKETGSLIVNVALENPDDATFVIPTVIQGHQAAAEANARRHDAIVGQ